MLSYLEFDLGWLSIHGRDIGIDAHFTSDRQDNEENTPSR